MTGPEKEALAVLQPFLGDELAKDVVAHRRGMKVPLTGRGAKTLIREYQKTGDAVAAAEHHLNMGWRGFSADWMKSKGKAFHDTANPAPRGDMAAFTRNLMDSQHGDTTVDDAGNRSAQSSLDYLAPPRRH